MNPFEEDAGAAAGPSSGAGPAAAPPAEDEAVSVSIDEIARKLLRESFYLTALELHLELAELGAELPRLRAFFSNPGNFERQTPFKPELSGHLPRSSSQATLDSIDLGRFSEDGERLADERTAVLEFELRKAHDTIKSLRANLTGAAELNTPDQGGDRPITDDDPIKPHERRALNFLVNEYLLRHGYKLTSIAFSDENEDQDVEDWDDVGLNVAKPPELLHFFREGGARRSDPAEQPAPAEPPPPPAVPRTEAACQTDEDPVHAQLENDITTLMDKVAVLESQLSAMRAAAANVPSTSAASTATAAGAPGAANDVTAAGDVTSNDVTAADEADDGSGEDSLASELARTESENRANCLRLAGQSHEADDSVMPESLRRALLSACVPEPPAAAADETVARLRREVGRPSGAAGDAVRQLARCLPHIVPNVILAKREELIPLLLTAIQLHPDIRERDVLLNLLFNLIKRPDNQQRQVILEGFRCLVSRLGPGRLEEEVLPQCWEQISHKYCERRLLVAEACAVLAPYIPSELRGSLVWSMLNQMVSDEKEPAVREAALRSMVVILIYRDDDEKFNQVWELTARLLEDRCEPVQRAASELLLPVVARWAAQLDKLSKLLVPHALNAAKQAADRRPAEWTVTVWLQTLSALLEHALLAVLADGPHQRRAADDGQTLGVPDGRLPTPAGPLNDLEVLHGDGRQLRHLVAAFDNYVSQEWYQMWPPLEWLLTVCVPKLIKLAERLPLSFPEAVYDMSKLLRYLAHLLGPTITDTKLWPVCESRLLCSGDEPPPGLSSALLPAVCGGLLSAPQTDAAARLARCLEDALYLSAACRTTGEPLAAAVRLLLEQEERHPALLDLVWKGCLHAVTEVRETTALLAGMLVPEVIESVLTSRVLPALVTLASDPHSLVRRAAVPALGLVLETRPSGEPAEKARLQLAALCADPALAGPLAAALGRATAAGRHAEFCLPRLAELAERRAAADAAPLLDAFTAIGCGHVPREMVLLHVLPALRFLLDTLVSNGLPQADAAAALVKDFEQRASASAPPEAASPSPSAAPVPSMQQGMEEVRSRVTKMLNSSAIQSKSSQITGLFKKK